MYISYKNTEMETHVSPVNQRVWPSPTARPFYKTRWLKTPVTEHSSVVFAVGTCVFYIYTSWYGALCLLDTIRYDISSSFECLHHFHPIHIHIYEYTHYMHIYMYCIHRVLPTKFKPCAIKGPGQCKGTECVAGDGPGERKGSPNANGSGWIWLPDCLRNKIVLWEWNNNNKKSSGWSRTRFYGLTPSPSWPVFSPLSLFFPVSVVLVNYPRRGFSTRVILNFVKTKTKKT